MAERELEIDVTRVVCRPASIVWSPIPCYFVTSAAGLRSAARRTFPLDSSMNRLFFIGLPSSVAIFSRISWDENRLAGHSHPAIKIIRAVVTRSKISRQELRPPLIVGALHGMWHAGRSMEPALSAWQRWGWSLRWGGTAAGIAYVAHLIDFDAAWAAFEKISPAALVLATALVGLGLVVGAARWRVLLAAYGAESRPSLARATKLYFISFFYNNYLPGAVAGDVVRGIATREVFGERGATAGLSVVLVERVLGLFGVFLLLAIGLATAGRAIDTESLWLWSAFGIACALALVLALPFARRLAPLLPGTLRTIAERVPELSSPVSFAIAALYSVVTQALIALAGWVLLHAIAPQVDLEASLLIVPLAAATTFLPITVGGAGAREAVYVMFGASLFHMPRSDALAASLALWLAHLVIGAAGGILQLTERRG